MLYFLKRNFVFTYFSDLYFIRYCFIFIDTFTVRRITKRGILQQNKFVLVVQKLLNIKRKFTKMLYPSVKRRNNP